MYKWTIIQKWRSKRVSREDWKKINVQAKFWWHQNPLSYHHPQPALYTMLSSTCKSHRDSGGQNEVRIRYEQHVLGYCKTATFLLLGLLETWVFFLIFFDIIFYQFHRRYFHQIPCFPHTNSSLSTPASPVPPNFDFSDLHCENTWRQNSWTSVLPISWKHWLPWHSYLSSLSILSL